MRMKKILGFDPFLSNLIAVALKLEGEFVGGGSNELKASPITVLRCGQEDCPVCRDGCPL